MGILPGSAPKESQASSGARRDEPTIGITSMQVCQLSPGRSRRS